MDITCEWSSSIDECDTYPVADLDFRNEGNHRYYCRSHLNILLDICDYITIADPMLPREIEPTRLTWVCNPEKLWCIFHAWPWVMCSGIDHRPLIEQQTRQQLTWHWGSIKIRGGPRHGETVSGRVCDNCGAEVWAFKEGLICSGYSCSRKAAHDSVE